MSNSDNKDNSKTALIVVPIVVALIACLGAVLSAIIAKIPVSSPSSVNILFTPTVEIISSYSTSTINFDVSSKENWQPALMVKKGDHLEIKYLSGSWTLNTDQINGLDPYVDANGYVNRGWSLPLKPVHSAPDGALIGKIGDGEPFYVGNQLSFIAGANGELSFQVNDEYTLNETQRGLKDNDGTITIVITVAQ